jgi:hypothetical protein
MILVYCINFHTQQTPKVHFPLAKICVLGVVFVWNCTHFFKLLLPQVTLNLLIFFSTTKVSILCLVVWLSWFDVRNKKCKVSDILWHHCEWSWFNKCGILHSSEHITVVNFKVMVFWDVMLYSLVSRLGVYNSCVPSDHGV